MIKNYDSMVEWVNDVHNSLSEEEKQDPYSVLAADDAYARTLGFIRVKTGELWEVSLTTVKNWERGPTFAFLQTSEGRTALAKWVSTKDPQYLNPQK